MKRKVTLTVGTLFFAAIMLGCTSTVTLGPKANATEVVGATAGTSGVSLTLPFVKAETSADTTKKKE
jgi:hypothetical protein